MASQLENRRRVAAVWPIAMPPRAGVTRSRRGAIDRPSAAPAGCGAAPKSMERDVLKRSATQHRTWAPCPSWTSPQHSAVSSETRSPERTHVEQQLVICPSRSARCLAQSSGPVASSSRWNLMRARSKSVAMPSRLVLPDSSAISAQFVFGEGGDKLACAWRAGHPVGGSVESRHDIATGASPSRKKSEPSIRIRSCQRARWLMVSFSQNETCCATREEWQSQVNAKSHPLQNEFQFWCFCGTFLYLDTRTTSKTPADGGMLPGEDAGSCARPHDVPSRSLRRPRRRRSGRSPGRRDHETCARALSIDQRQQLRATAFSPATLVRLRPGSLLVPSRHRTRFLPPATGSLCAIMVCLRRK
jgi:hypothetical protein